MIILGKRDAINIGNSHVKALVIITLIRGPTPVYRLALLSRQPGVNSTRICHDDVIRMPICHNFTVHEQERSESYGQF